MSESSGSSHHRPSFTHQVFLNFRGEDTRAGFTSHLYRELTLNGIRTFIDDVEIERGGEITSELKDAIEESEIFVVIFSEKYASSSWCLDELAMIYECKARKQQLILPIFYHVDPSEVRHQTGKYGEALADHEKDEANPEKKAKIQKWRAALTEAANTSGHHLLPDRDESVFLGKILKDIHKRLNCRRLHMGENIVGMNFHLDKLKSSIDVELSKVRVIGICGIGGIGKTTIAKAIYNSIFHQFDSSCFLEIVGGSSKSSGLLELQQKLLRDILKGRDLNFHSIDEGINVIKERLHSKRVLIVVDNVDDSRQLECLIGKHDWLCGGSRIIITTRNKHLLDVHGVDEIYEPQELSDEESVELFCRHAFKQSLPRDGYQNTMNRAVKYAKGHPLALKVLGDHLFNKTIPEWESSLCKLERELHPDIRSVLQMSFDGLDDIEKKIFLDIACFFKGKEKDFVLRILDGCKFYGASGISVLVDKSLVTVSKLKHLRCLPSGIHKLKLLKSLRCSGCSKVEIFPEIEEMENLRELYLDGTGIRNLPSSIKQLRGVEYLDLGHCENLESLPETICDLVSLKKLIANHCPTLRKSGNILIGIGQCAWQRLFSPWPMRRPSESSELENPPPKATLIYENDGLIFFNSFA